LGRKTRGDQVLSTEEELRIARRALKEVRLGIRAIQKHEQKGRSGDPAARKARVRSRQPAAPLEDVARFAYLSGWRRGEIVGLRWENVDRAGREVRIYTSKNGEGRVLPLDEELGALIERRWTAREYADFRGEPGLSAFVFHRQGRPPGNFTKAWRLACQKASVPGRLFHDLRRTAVREMIRGGVSQHVAMAISGHKTPSMFQRYNITSAEDKLDALQPRTATSKRASPRGL
jgi:integrase